MATSSFDKHFRVKGKAAAKFLDALKNCTTAFTFRRKDINAESKQSAEIIKLMLNIQNLKANGKAVYKKQNAEREAFLKAPENQKKISEIKASLKEAQLTAEEAEE